MDVLLDGLLVPVEASVRAALEVMDRSGRGSAFVVDSGGRLKGMLTDGDIRRGLLRGVDLEAPIIAVMTAECFSLPYDADRETIAQSLNERIRIVPLVDATGRVVDYASEYRYHTLSVAEPSLVGNEVNYVLECLRTNWISSQGPFVKRFESSVAEYLGMPYAVAVSNGTAALHLALVALGIGPGDEVIVPDLTFAASANAVLYVGARPVLVDVNRETWTIEVDAIAPALSPRTRAIMPVHLYGQPCAMEPILELARQRKLLVVEDAAEGLGALYRGTPVGALGDAAAFSFFGNKLITTGEGGMVAFRDRNVAQRARRLRDHGMDPQRRYWHTEVGFNYRLTSLQAALGVAQMERIEDFIQRKLRLAASYEAGLRSLDGLRLPTTQLGDRNVYWLYSVIVDSAHAGMSRDDLMSRLLCSGIETRPLFYPLHTMPPYRSCGTQGPYDNAEWLAGHGLSLPSGVTLRDEDVHRVTAAIRQAMAVRRLARFSTGQASRVKGEETLVRAAPGRLRLRQPRGTVTDGDRQN